MSSFECLYTFADVAIMYNIDQSTSRRNVGVRFIDGEDANKLGKPWIDREEALIREFGFIAKVKDKKVSNVEEKVGIKSAFDKCKEAYLNSK
ncbi:hypothetical protein [Paraclostridium sordellii]|uniref:hypothetical protein n=1 Tax=Paraclostridium sordellii TaxID=1505 RepID=UPI0005DFF97B|nr:hypothetical protein [Paeniclostridium sordellii]CEO21027.1 Uncharacterised protein [[Clostridium] sordellii] [Paeniclostridium sordellii]